MRPSRALMMQATKALRMGHGPDPKNGVYVEAGKLANYQLRGKEADNSIDIWAGGETWVRIIF